MDLQKFPEFDSLQNQVVYYQGLRADFVVVNTL